MKLVLISLLSLSVLANVSASAKSGGFNFSLISQPLHKQDDKVKIKKEDLPEPIKKALRGEGFKEWIIMKAYKLSNGEFEVELRKGSAFQTIQFDKDGVVK